MQPAPVSAAAASAPELEQVQQQVAEWLRFDKDDASRARVQGMLDSNSHAELKELMCQRLEFGECTVLYLRTPAPPPSRSCQ